MANAKQIYAKLLQAVRDRFSESIPNRLPSKAFQDQHIKVIDSLIRKGIWDGLDFFYYFASDDNFTLKTLNWIDPYGVTGSFGNESNPSVLKFGSGYNNQSLVLKDGTYFDTNINLKTTLINGQTPKINNGPTKTFIGFLKGPSTFGSTTFFGVGDAADPTFTGNDNDMIALMVGSSGFQNALFRSFNTAKGDGDYNYKTGAFINYKNTTKGLFNFSNITSSLKTSNLDYRAGMYIVEHSTNYTNWIYNNKIVRQDFKTIKTNYPGKVPDGDILLGAIGAPSYVKNGYASSVERPFVTQSFGSFNQGTLNPTYPQTNFAVLSDDVLALAIPRANRPTWATQYVELPPRKIEAVINYANGAYVNTVNSIQTVTPGKLKNDYTGNDDIIQPELVKFEYDYSKHFKSYQDVYNNPQDGDIFWSKWPDSITSGSNFEIEISRIALTSSSNTYQQTGKGLFNFYKENPIVQYINPFSVKKVKDNVLTYDGLWINNNPTKLGFTVTGSLFQQLKSIIRITNDRVQANILAASIYGSYWISGNRTATYYGNASIEYGWKYWGDKYGPNPLFPFYSPRIIRSGQYNKTFCVENSPSYQFPDTTNVNVSTTQQYCTGVNYSINPDGTELSIEKRDARDKPIIRRPPISGDLLIKPYEPINCGGICCWYPPAAVQWAYSGIKSSGFLNGKTFDTVATNIFNNSTLRSVLIDDQWLIEKRLNLPIKSLLPPPPYGKLLQTWESGLIKLGNTAQFYLKNTGALIGFAIDHEFSPDYYGKNINKPDPSVGWTGLLNFTDDNIINIKDQNFVVEKQKWTIRALVNIPKNEWKTSFPSSSIDTTFIVDISNSNRKIASLNLETKNFSKEGYFTNIKGKSDVNLDGVDISQTYITDAETNSLLLFDEITDKKVVKSIIDFKKDKTFEIRTSDPRFSGLKSYVQKLVIPIGLVSNKLKPGTYATESFTVTNQGSSTGTIFNYITTTSWPTSSFQTIDKNTVFITNAAGGVLYSPQELDDVFFEIPISGTLGSTYTFNYKPLFGSKDDAGKLTKILSNNTYYLKHRIPDPNYTTNYSGTGINQSLGSGTTQTFICAFGGGQEFDDLTEMYKIFYDAAYSAYFSAANLPKKNSIPLGNTDVTLGLPLLHYGNDAKFSVILQNIGNNVTKVNWQTRTTTPTDSLKNMIDPTQAVDATILNYTTSSLTPSFYLYNPLP